MRVSILESYPQRQLQVIIGLFLSFLKIAFSVMYKFSLTSAMDFFFPSALAYLFYPVVYPGDFSKWLTQTPLILLNGRVAFCHVRGLLCLSSVPCWQMCELVWNVFTTKKPLSHLGGFWSVVSYVTFLFSFFLFYLNFLFLFFYYFTLNFKFILFFNWSWHILH